MYLYNKAKHTTVSHSHYAGVLTLMVAFLMEHLMNTIVRLVITIIQFLFGTLYTDDPL